jgi:hypothetical protein
MSTIKALTKAILRDGLLHACRRGYIGVLREFLREKRVRTNRVLLAEAILEAGAHGRVIVVTELLLLGK